MKVCVTFPSNEQSAFIEQASLKYDVFFFSISECAWSYQMLRDKLSNSLEKLVLQPKDSFPTFMLIVPSGLVALS